MVAAYLRAADDDLLLPHFTVEQLLPAFRKFNIKVGADGKPASAGMWRAIEWLESQLPVSDTRTCACCNAPLQM